MAAGTALSGNLQSDLTWRIAHQVLPLQTGEPCGDAAGDWAWGAAEGANANGRLLAIVDGLGHGGEAALAAHVALDCLGERPQQALADLLAEADRRLVGLRGAAIGLLQMEGATARHAGVGNTRCLRWRGGRAQRMASQPGIVGGGLPAHINLATFDLAAGDWILMFTDGVDERLDLPVWLPEWDREPGLLCSHLLARWRASRDDAGVLVAQAIGG
jgi:Stage II sporulation protein E (SpoIIE)